MIRSLPCRICRIRPRSISIFGAFGPSPAVADCLSAAGDPVAGAMRDIVGNGGFRGNPVMGRAAAGFFAAVFALRARLAIARHAQPRDQRARRRAVQDLRCQLGYDVARA